jgi:hypothetical protein
MKKRSSWTLVSCLIFLGLLRIEHVAYSANPTFEKVMIIVLENADYKDALKQPAFSQLAQGGALFTDFNGEIHPSQGNYIAMASGSHYGVDSDKSVDLDVRHIGDLLEAKNKSWKAYLEDYPGGCFTGKRSQNYVRKHNPFISFVNIQSDESRCKAHLVEASVLSQDVRNNKVPDYSLYVPNLKNDGHDTGVGYADRWFSRVFGPLLKDPNFMKNMLLVLTFDESEKYDGNHIFTAFYGDSVIPGSKSTARSDHYSVLRLIEDQFGLGNLGQEDRSASSIIGIWK